MYITAVIGNRVLNVHIERKSLDVLVWYIVDVHAIYPNIAPLTSIAKRHGEWVLTGPRSELSIDDIQAIGEWIDANEG